MTTYWEWRYLGDPNDASTPEPEVIGELELYFHWQRYGSLPWDGGLMDQPHLTLEMMNLCGNLEDEFARVAKNLRSKNNGSAT